MWIVNNEKFLLCNSQKNYSQVNMHCINLFLAVIAFVASRNFVVSLRSEHTGCQSVLEGSSFGDLLLHPLCQASEKGLRPWLTFQVPLYPNSTQQRNGYSCC